MKHSITLLFALAIGIAACKSEQPSAVPSSGDAPPPHDHHEKMAGPAAAFHDVLAPIWHSDKGPDRTAKACDATKTMREQAGAIMTAAPPAEVKAEDYAASAKALGGAVDALATACAADGRPDVDAKLGDVHEAYHKVAELSGSGHDEHHEHHHGEEHH